jgi:hypothetical protein
VVAVFGAPVAVFGGVSDADDGGGVDGPPTLWRQCGNSSSHSVMRPPRGMGFSVVCVQRGIGVDDRLESFGERGEGAVLPGPDKVGERVELRAQRLHRGQQVVDGGFAVLVEREALVERVGGEGAVLAEDPGAARFGG